MRHLALLVAAVLGAGCGANGDEDVVREWADLLREGRVAHASNMFAVPAVVANTGAPMRLETRADVELFNRTLPCGARVIGSERAGDRIVVDFRLTERAGAGGGECGEGVGGTARVEFLIRDALIVEWLRVLPADPEV